MRIKRNIARAIALLAVMLLAAFLYIVCVDRYEYTPIEISGSNILLSKKMIFLVSPNGLWSAYAGWCPRGDDPNSFSLSLEGRVTGLNGDVGLSSDQVIDYCYRWDDGYDIYWDEANCLVVMKDRKYLGRWMFSISERRIWWMPAR